MMAAEDNLNPKQFKWTPEKFGTNIADHLRREHTDTAPIGGWSRTILDAKAHAKLHATEDLVAGTTPHKHFTPKNPR